MNREGLVQSCPRFGVRRQSSGGGGAKGYAAFGLERGALLPKRCRAPFTPLPPHSKSRHNSVRVMERDWGSKK